jgi:hypothetical protein
MTDTATEQATLRGGWRYFDEPVWVCRPYDDPETDALYGPKSYGVILEAIMRIDPKSEHAPSHVDDILHAANLLKDGGQFDAICKQLAKRAGWTIKNLKKRQRPSLMAPTPLAPGRPAHQYRTTPSWRVWLSTESDTR